MFAFVLAAHNPEAAGLGLFEGVEAAAELFEEKTVENDFDGGRGLAPTTMHDLRPKFLVEAEIEIVQCRVDFVIHS